MIGSNRMRSVWVALLLAVLALAGCSGSASDSGDPAEAVEAYFQALVEKDANRLSSLSCSAWEAEAQKELNSFGAVTAELKDLSCDSSGEEGEAALVTCSGIIAANYGNEVLEIDLADRPLQAVYEGDEWRMCGYR